MSMIRCFYHKAETVPLILVMQPFSIGPAVLTYITLEYGRGAIRRQWLKLHLKDSPRFPAFCVSPNEKCQGLHFSPNALWHFFYYYQPDTQISCSFTQITLNSSTCFERNSPIIRLPTQIVHIQPLVASLSASDCLVQPLRENCLCTICVGDLLMMGELRSKHVEKFNLK
jgi:hypothetical protein